MKERKQNSTSYPITFLLVSSTDHVSPVTGITPAVTISKNGGSFASPSGTVTEIGNGWYALAGHATDRGTLGTLLLHATGTGADPADDRYTIVPWDPFDAVNMGLSNLDAAISTLPSASAIATAVWAAGTRTLSSFGTLAADVWASATRTLSAFSFSVTASSVTDKTGYSLLAAPPTAAAIRAEMDANSTKLANLDTNVGSRLATSGYTAPTTPPTATQIADAVLTRDWTAVSGEASRSVLNALRALRNRVSRVTGKVYKEDDATQAWTFSATTDASANPITEVDPS